jgi:hypothetical protein
MSQNTHNGPGSPSDRFFPIRVANKAIYAPPQLNRFLSPTSDLSQAIGNSENATQGQYQAPSYQPPHQVQAYQPSNQPQTHQPQSYQPQIYHPQSSQNRSGQSPKPSSIQASIATQKREPKRSSRSNRPYWSPEEDALILKLRGENVTWENIAKEIPGRTATGCRLHFQSALERINNWSEDRKNQLAHAYEEYFGHSIFLECGLIFYDRKKEDMWQKIALAMGCSIDEVEAMHWEMGEVDLASRAGITPFFQLQRSSGGA